MNGKIIVAAVDETELAKMINDFHETCSVKPNIATGIAFGIVTAVSAAQGAWKDDTKLTARLIADMFNLVADRIGAAVTPFSMRN